MSAPDGYSPGFGPAPRPKPASPPAKPAPPPAKPASPPAKPAPHPPRYDAQASNQGYQQQQQQQPTSGSSGAVVVVAPRYCLAQELSLAVTKKVLSSSRGDWTIRDPEGNILFSVHGNVQTVDNRRHLHLLDAAGYKVIHMQRKRKDLGLQISRRHYVWHMYAGDSDQLICTVKKSRNVFVASNTTEMPDFTLEGNFFERNLKILRGQQAIAQVTQQTPLIDKYTFGITVFPRADYAFVIALLAIHLHNGQ